MSEITKEDVVKALGNLTVMEMIALTKKLEAEWGVKAEPPTVQVQQKQEENKQEAQTEFTVNLVSVPADKKMSVIKVVRELTLLGLKESKELVEAAPKTIKDGLSRADADEIVRKLTEAGGVTEVK